MPFATARKSARSSLVFTLRERLLTGVLVLVSCFAIAQMGVAQKSDIGLQTAYADTTMLPSELPGENFPGSAFYYVEDDVGLVDADKALALWQDPGTDNVIRSDSGDIIDTAVGVGAAARPMRLVGTAQDRNRALQCLTTAIYYEAATEPDAGQRAVAQVILNRVAHPSYPDTVCGVVYQGSERASGCQFTFSCDGSMARAPARFYWDRARNVAADALSGKVYAPAGLATHYHTSEVSPYWAPSLHFLGTIGAHRFYRWKGSAGLKSAFYESYRGLEPFPGPKPKSYAASRAASTDPVALARAYDEAKATAELQAAQGSKPELSGYSPVASEAPRYVAPAYSSEAARRGGEKAFGGENLPEQSQIQPQYQQSGQWIGKPVS